MKAITLLKQSNWLAFPRTLGHKIGKNETLILMQLIDSADKFGNEWFFITSEKLYQLTCCTYKEQKKALKNLVDLGLIQIELKGLPRKKYFKINESEILVCTKGTSKDAPKVNTSTDQRDEQDSTKGTGIYKDIDKDIDKDNKDKDSDFEDEEIDNEKENPFSSQKSVLVEMFKLAKKKKYLCNFEDQDERDEGKKLREKIKSYIKQQKKDDGYTDWSVKDHEILFIFENLLDNAPKFWTGQFSFKGWAKNFQTVINAARKEQKENPDYSDLINEIAQKIKRR